VIEAVVREKTLIRENETLDNLNRTKTEFLQNMSHDLKTPLTVVSTSILNAADMLDYEIDKEEMRESLSFAQSEIMRLSRIVDESIKHAALYSDKKLSEPIDLSKLLFQIKKMYSFFLERYGNVLSISIPKEIPQINCNTDVLINIFSNLISNANRFTKNGDIIISAELTEKTKALDAPDFVRITISDTGRGISQNIINDIFERGTSETGSGLGLAICKRAIETYGGTISAKSEEGKGTQLTFTLPVYNQFSDN
jgi:two-component system sensor histidine kinase ChiS